MDELLKDDKENEAIKIKRNNMKNKTKRGHKKHKVNNLNIFSSNAAQLEGKLQSFKNELKIANASVFTLQETHYASKGQF